MHRTKPHDNPKSTILLSPKNGTSAIHLKDGSSYNEHMASKQYKFRLHPEDEGSSIYIGELLESSDDTEFNMNTGGTGDGGPLKVRFRLKDEGGGIYIGELLEDEHCMEGNDAVKEEVGQNNEDDLESEGNSDSTRTMECEQSNVLALESASASAFASEPFPSLDVKEVEEGLDDAPFKLEEVYVTDQRRPAIEIGKLPLNIRYEVYQWLFNHPGDAANEILEIPEGWMSWPGF